MAKVKKTTKKASKKSPKKTNHRQQVRLLEAEILASRMRDFAGEESPYGAYGVYDAYGVYGAYGAYGFSSESPVAIQIRPNGRVIIRADFRRTQPLTIQIWPGGQISVQEHRGQPNRPKQTLKGKTKATKKDKKSKKK